MSSYVICEWDRTWQVMGDNRAISQNREVFVQVVSDGGQPIRSRCLDIAEERGVKIVQVGDWSGATPVADSKLLQLRTDALAYCLSRAARDYEIFIEDSPEYTLKFNKGRALSERQPWIGH